MGIVGYSGWSFVSAVPGQMTHLVASLTLDSASYGDNIRHDGFLPSILLLLVIIVAVVIVVTVVLVVVVGEADSIPIGWANEFHQDKASSVKVPVANFTLQSSIQLLRENTDSVCSNQQMRLTAPSVPLKLKGWKLINSL
ncbi:hypothetical protein Tco_0809443 [Tanacetum coccineum]